MTQSAIEVMNKQGSGHVVTVTTSLVDQPMTSVPAVLASIRKGALNAATKSLAIECGKNGVRVNAFSPGIIKTPMHPLEVHQFLASLHPMGGAVLSSMRAISPNCSRILRTVAATTRRIVEGSSIF